MIVWKYNLAFLSDAHCKWVENNLFFIYYIQLLEYVFYVGGVFTLFSLNFFLFLHKLAIVIFRGRGGSIYLIPHISNGIFFSQLVIEYKHFHFHGPRKILLIVLDYRYKLYKYT
jgi:hypothetical protein